ncbi:hypothetical protein X566_04650 [Afipia sp. P52-10]|jgi:hypothetical protein|uniref:hypothetical protein n=1 Tax=Afipia sp. P52-10 TaxID=1429916 RepID=UPI0003DF3E99|nr:hypothetical protein [Afipia sp. P52-10]ETR76991.1 hypothetical protein X566_04650 [Afipia sp. P52-10]
MADYYPLIARAVAGLDANSTGEQRRALYERARSALIAQLRGVQPPLTESEITRERLTLEEAIRKVEQEAAQRSRAASREAIGRGRGDLLRASQPSINPAAPGPDAPAGDKRTERPAPPPRDTGRPPEPREPRSTDRDSLLSRSSRAPDPRPATRPDRPTLAQRRERERAERNGAPAANGGEGVRGFRDVMADANELGGAAAQANRSARRTFANVPSPSPEFDRIEPSMEDRSGAGEFAPPPQGGRQEPPYSFDESPDEAERYRDRSQYDRPPPRPEPASRGRQRSPLNTGFLPVKRAAAVGLVLILIGAVIAYWPSLRGFYSEFTGAKQVEAPKKGTTPADRPKITDRVGQPSDSPVAPVAQRVVLYDEDPAEPQGKQYVGQVVWRTENVAGPNGTTDLAIRADIDIPERKFKATLSIRRNNDTTLPASHTVEMTFQLPPDFVGGGVSNVPGVLMKSNEQTRGTPLAGLAVKVTDNFFLIGLSNVEADRSRNMQLLKERSWFDIPLVYSNQRRAIVALEKGAPGDRAFEDAFAAWGQ